MIKKILLSFFIISFALSSTGMNRALLKTDKIDISTLKDCLCKEEKKVLAIDPNDPCKLKSHLAKKKLKWLQWHGNILKIIFKRKQD